MKFKILVEKRLKIEWKLFKYEENLKVEMKENKKIWLCIKTDGKDKTDVLILLFWLKSDIKFDIKYWFDQLIKTSADSNETIWLKFLISVK